MHLFKSLVIVIVLSGCLPVGDTAKKCARGENLAEGQCVPDVAPSSDGSCRQDDPGRRAQCLGSQYADKLISSAEFAYELQKVVRMLPSDGSYWSAGITTGDLAFVVARQDHYLFDAEYVHLSADVARRWYSGPIELDHPVGDGRPGVIWAEGAQGLTELGSLPMLTKPAGTNSMPVLYRSSIPSLPTFDASNCDRFKAWDKENGFSKANILVALPGNTYCPSVAKDKYQVAIGKLHPKTVGRSGAETTLMVWDWMIHSGGSEGRVPSEMSQAEQDFQ